jgi:hypothetical protein
LDPALHVALSAALTEAERTALVLNLGPIGACQPAPLPAAEWVDAVSAHFGVRPVSSLQFTVHSSRKADHRAVGELALACIQCHGGVIDLGGALEVGSGEALRLDEMDDLIARVEGRVDWADVSAPTEAFLETMPGRVLTLPYETASGHTWVRHICDADFMAAWLRHPSFHLIK